MALRRFFRSSEAPTTRDVERLLTTEQVRERLQLHHVNAVYRLVRNYGLPRQLVGGVYRFRPSEIDAWLDAQRQQVPALRAVR